MNRLEFTTASDENLPPSSSAVGTHPFHGGQAVVGLFNDLSEYNVLAIKPGSLRKAKEELDTIDDVSPYRDISVNCEIYSTYLASVGVGACVGHAEDTRAGVLVDEVFVLDYRHVSNYRFEHVDLEYYVHFVP